MRKSRKVCARCFWKEHQSDGFTALMLGIALTSVAAGVFDVKHYLHLQLVPHISKFHQVRIEYLSSAL